MQHCLIFELISLSKIFGIVSDKQSKWMNHDVWMHK
jgi:hypothetical protein